MSNIIIDFMTNNQMKIDKSIYFTVIIAQLTIYGIFLTFVQFIANIDNGGKNRVHYYLGFDINNFYINKELGISKVIRSKVFLGILILSFFIKPILVISNSFINDSTKSLIAFGWYAFSIIYMIIFAIVFVKCAQLTMIIKRIGENSKYNLVLNDIEEEFIIESNKLYMKEKRGEEKAFNETEIDKFRYILSLMKKLYEKDNNCDLLVRYDKLTIRLLKEYYIKKQSEIKLLVEKGICVKNQEGFEYNFKFELEVLNGLIEEVLQREKIDNKFIEGLLEIRMKILNRSIERKIIDGIKDNQSNQGITIQDKHEVWGFYELMLKHNVFINNIRYLVDILYSDNYFILDNAKYIIQSQNRMEISKLLILCFGLVCNEKMDQTQFVNIFHKVLNQEKFKETFTMEVSELFRRECIPKNIENIIKLLDERQKVYILIYLIIYYSIYDSREEWKYFDLVKLSMMLPQEDDFLTILDENKDYIISRLKNSINKNRFNEHMIDTLIDYLRQGMSDELIIKVYTNKIINVFYLFVFKVGILKQDLYYQEYNFSNNRSLNIGFLKFLSKHPELFKHEKFKTFLYILRENTFSKEKDIDYEIKNDFQCLILADIPVNGELVAKLKEDGKYLFSDSIKYLLIKTIELKKYNNIEDENWIKKNIVQDFISSNKSVDMYLQDIVNIYEKYHLNISYIQKEKINKFMHKCLLEIM